MARETFTFPKTGPNDWTNARTGVRIHRHFTPGLTTYRVFMPTIEGQEPASSGRRTLAEARARAMLAAKAVIANREIAHAQALAEQALTLDTSTPLAQSIVEADHAEALDVNEQWPPYTPSADGRGFYNYNAQAHYNAKYLTAGDRESTLTALHAEALDVEKAAEDAFYLAFGSLPAELTNSPEGREAARLGLHSRWTQANAIMQRLVKRAERLQYEPTPAGRPAGWGDAWLEVSRPAQIDLVYGPGYLDAMRYLMAGEEDRPRLAPGPY